MSYFSVYFKLLIALVQYGPRCGVVGIASLAQLPVTAAIREPRHVPRCIPVHYHNRCAKTQGFLSKRCHNAQLQRERFKS